ncbi:O-acetyl-ADP-ribose deacetylase MACROD2-like protein [Aphelenchoides avenae]|nr:O-acetyl-ADP-ribose deacetylase MACROD2-like protein [Aphelenchus avenae]
MPPKSKRQRQSQRARASDSVAPTILPQQECKVTLVQCNIVSLPVDAIVNAANTELKRGGGVCGSIFQAAGRGLDTACAALNRCATGDAVLTDAFGIRNVKAVVHAVGPQVVGPLTDQHRRELACSYMRSLDVVLLNGLKSIAFPCISTAIYGFPNDEAAQIALGAVKQWLDRDNNGTKLSQIVFCTFLDKDRAIYQGLMPDIFPDHVDETGSAAARAQGRPHESVIEKSMDAADDRNVAIEESTMPPPAETQLSAKRKRGRPPMTPTVTQMQSTPSPATMKYLTPRC